VVATAPVVRRKSLRLNSFEPIMSSPRNVGHAYERGDILAVTGRRLG